MSDRRLVIFGRSVFARLMLTYFRHDTDYQVVAFTVSADRLESDRYLGLPVLPFETLGDSYPPGTCALFIAVGYSGFNSVRAELCSAAKQKGYALASYASPQASHGPDAAIGEHCCLLAGSRVEPYAQIGNDVVMWTGSCVSHDSRVGDHCFLAPNAAIAGFVRVGERCFVGPNATVTPGVQLGDRSFVGAGALVTHDVGTGEAYLGTPARRYEGDPRRLLDT